MVTWPPSSSAAPLNYVLRRRMVMSMPSRCDPVSYFCLFQISPDNKALITLKNQTKKPRECKQPPQNIFLNWILPVGTRMKGRRGGLAGLLDAASEHNGFCKDTHPTAPTKHHSQGWLALFVVVIVVLCSISFQLIRGFLLFGGSSGNIFTRFRLIPAS